MRVPHDLPSWRHAAELVGRRAECAALDQLIRAVRAGESRALVVHGEPGVGKTALLDHVAVRALDFRVVRVGCIQSEMELPFAGLHQLCVPLLDRVRRLPQPQGEALRVAFGMSSGASPDRFHLGLAVLGLLSEAAEERPLVCLIDDEQWLDRASGQVLAFVARRLGAESVGLIIATRTVGSGLQGLPELAVAGLRAADAGRLLDTVVTGPVDAIVREQIIVETQGNPLALLELPSGLSPAELAGGFGLPSALTLPSSIEESFGRRVGALNEGSRQLLLIAASEPSGDPALVSRAATLLGIDPCAVTAAADAGLLEVGTRIRFRHPLARSAVYQGASPEGRRRVHRALADAVDPDLDPDRRAWHRAQAAAGPDEDVAGELERSAGRAQARGGMAAAAAFLLRAATLTIDPAKRSIRSIAAAEAQLQAGSFDEALELLIMTDASTLSDAQRVQVALIRARLAFVMNRGRDASPLLLDAAKQLEQTDPSLARATYLDALSAAIVSDRLASPGGDVLAVARAVDAAPPPPDEPRTPDLLLDGYAAMYNRGPAAGMPTLHRAVAEFGDGMSDEEQLHWLWLGSTAAMTLCADDHWNTLSTRHLELARRTGALSQLPMALTLRSLFLLFSGDIGTAAVLADEVEMVREATGAHLAPSAGFIVAALRGDAGTPNVFQAALEDAVRRGEGIGIIMAEWAQSAYWNSVGRYHDAFDAARRSVGARPDRGPFVLPLIQLIEAAVRTEQAEAAAAAYRQLAVVTSASGTDWALGLRARSKALLSVGDEADALYRESIERLGRTLIKVDLARVHLLYGEWLRRERRNTEARDQLRTAQSMFEQMGATSYGERADRELRATGATVRPHVDTDPAHELTAQETLIATMARDGLSNPEIASRLFISPHTVQYHLRKVFRKLDISARGDLRRFSLQINSAPVSAPGSSSMR